MGIVIEPLWVLTQENALDPLSRGLAADTMLNEAKGKYYWPPQKKQHGRRTLDTKRGRIL